VSFFLIQNFYPLEQPIDTSVKNDKLISTAEKKSAKQEVEKPNGASFVIPTETPKPKFNWSEDKLVLDPRLSWKYQGEVTTEFEDRKDGDRAYVNLLAKKYISSSTLEEIPAAWYCYNQLLKLGWNLTMQGSSPGSETVEMGLDGHFVLCTTKATSRDPIKYQSEVLITY
jgi:hypothetical protein